MELNQTIKLVIKNPPTNRSHVHVVSQVNYIKYLKKKNINYFTTFFQTLEKDEHYSHSMKLVVWDFKAKQRNHNKKKTTDKYSTFNKTLVS